MVSPTGNMLQNTPIGLRRDQAIFPDPPLMVNRDRL